MLWQTILLWEILIEWTEKITDLHFTVHQGVEKLVKITSGMAITFNSNKHSIFCILGLPSKRTGENKHYVNIYSSWPPDTNCALKTMLFWSKQSIKLLSKVDYSFFIFVKRCFSAVFKNIQFAACLCINHKVCQESHKEEKPYILQCTGEAVFTVLWRRIKD